MMMNVNDRKRKKVEGINTEQMKYNSVAGKFVYIINTETENNVIIYDWKTKTQTIILDGIKMIDRY